MNIKRTLGILTLSALSYMTLGCEPRKVSQKTDTPAVIEVAKPAELPTDRKGITKRTDYVAEIDFGKGTILFYQNGANRNFAIEYTTGIPASLEGKPEQARAYASAITYGLDMLVSHGRNTAHKAQLASTETDDYTARTEYTGKEIIEAYFHNLDGKDGSIDGRISAEEFGPKKLQKWLKMSPGDFRNEFPLHIDNGPEQETGYGRKRNPTYQELLRQGESDGAALNDVAGSGRLVSREAMSAGDRANERLEARGALEAERLNRPFKEAYEREAAEAKLYGKVRK